MPPASQVQNIFTRIAPRYDLMNRLMTGGQDVAWRRLVIQRARLAPGDQLLDLGAGTGDLAREALRQQPACRVTAADFTLAMMRAGQRRAGAPLQWCAADAQCLPLADASQDALVSGFLLRNVAALDEALREQLRVLRRGGRWVALDTTCPRRSWLSPFIHFYMHRLIPLLGQALTGQRDAYTYLPETSEAFLRAEELAARLAAVGFKHIGFQRLNFGTVAVHWGEKE